MFQRVTTTVAAGLLACAGTGAAAQSVEPEQEPHPFIAAISDHVIEIDRDAAGNLSGPGFDLLVQEAGEAQFFLIGETHATADVALVASAIHRALAPQGYEHLVVEIGPWSTRFVEETVRSGDGALGSHVASPGNGLILPFLSFEEEIAFVEQAIALSPHGGHVLWGVDQEFIAAAPILAPQLVAMAGNNEQTAAAAAFAAANRSVDAEPSTQLSDASRKLDARAPAASASPAAS